MSGHTEGPWYQDDNGDVREEASDALIARICDGGHLNRVPNIPFDVMNDNAKLIAAAPELLSALENIRYNWGGHSEHCKTVLHKEGGKCDCDWPEVAGQCDAAIMKATGEQQ